MCFFFCVFFKQKTAYEMRISDWSSDVCSSVLLERIVVDGEIQLDLPAIGDLVDPRLTPGTDAARHQCIVARPQQIGLVGADAAVAGPEADIDPHLARLDRVVRYERGYAIGEFRSEEHTSELQSLMHISYAVF